MLTIPVPPMSHDTLPYIQSKYQCGSENCWVSSETTEGSPSTLSANASLPSPTEGITDLDLYPDKSQIDGFPSTPSSLFHELSCLGPQDFADILETLPPASDIPFTTEEQKVIDSVLCSQIDFPTPFFSNESECENSLLLPKMSRQFTTSSDHRLHHVADFDRQSKKRKLNRDAAYRYRQKVKARNETLLTELREAVDAYEVAHKEYENARDAFDALKTALRKPLSDAAFPCSRPVFY